MLTKREAVVAGSVILAVLLVGHQALGDQLVVNGSFEQGPDPTINPWVTTFYAGSNAITGWVVTSGSIDCLYSDYWLASDGERVLDLNGLSAGGISQTFATTPGQSYEVLFDQSGNPEAGSRISQMRVLAATQSADFQFDTTGHSATDMGWATRSWTFTAADVSTALEFVSLDYSNPRFGPALDNVRISVIPEPATLAVLALGALAMVRRRKSR
jgi:choice-of-anchor C domain-containing protein